MRDLTLLLDMSGSMNAVLSDTLGGVNGMLDAQREMGDECNFTLITFNHETRLRFDHQPVGSIPVIDRDVYLPSGNTALLDAIGTAVELKRKQFAEGTQPEVVRFAILTDGQENASREYTKQAVVKLLAECEANGWEVLFMGSDMSAVADMSSMTRGADHSQVVMYDANKPAVAFQSMSTYFSGSLSPKKDPEDDPKES